MKLVDLKPRWIHPHIFIFRCPHCEKVWLTCKDIALSWQETWDLLKAGLGDTWNEVVVPPKPECAWKIEGTFPETTTVTPSIDASASGHWHGFITNGEIR